ncbi:MAG: DegT/DnrJ/EryC1/StrS family aminotransferase [Planctomycetaceae bacterium]|nr:DegT/DnrJ/EryC1/StrS family aminotransferase [Planctomycetaceae bacterium]
MNVPFVDLSSVHQPLAGALTAAIDRVMASSAFAGGPEVEAFETSFATYCGTDYCVGVGSGTAALELVLRAAGVGSGDEVIVPVNTFVADAEAVLLAGATPVFVDVDAGTGLVDGEAVAAAVGENTAAILPVHLYGQPAAMAPLQALAARQGLLLVEDACQAHGAGDDGRRVGSLGDAAAFSFYPSKNLGALGEAGCVTTDDATLAGRLRMLRDHGSRERYRHELLGRNDRMDGLQAAALGIKLPHLDGWNARRRELAARYRRGLAAVEGVVCLAEREAAEHVFHLFVVRVSQRDRVREGLQAAGIGTGIHYPVPLHLQPCCAQLGYREGAFPVAETLAGEILSLPMFPGLSDDQVDRVIGELRSLL